MVTDIQWCTKNILYIRYLFRKGNSDNGEDSEVSLLNW